MRGRPVLELTSLASRVNSTVDSSSTLAASVMNKMFDKAAYRVVRVGVRRGIGNNILKGEKMPHANAPNLGGKCHMQMRPIWE